MEWWIIGGLALVVIMLIAVYRASLRENRNITHYALMMLADPGVYEAQRKSLLEFISKSDAKGASSLGSEVYVVTGNLANRLSFNALAVAGILWKLKSGV